MALLVTCATVLELRAALGGLKDLRGLTPGKPLPLGAMFGLVTGVGPVAAGFCLGRALGRLEGRLEGVLGLGVAGTFAPESVPLGATVAVTSERWPEYGLAGDDGVDPRGLPFPLFKDAGSEVYDFMELDPEARAGQMGLQLPGGWLRAGSLTVASASGSSAVAAQRRLLGADMENMEGFALALGCRMAGVPFLQVRTVSNLVGARPPQGWNLDAALDGLGRAAQSLLNGLAAQE